MSLTKLIPALVVSLQGMYPANNQIFELPNDFCNSRARQHFHLLAVAASRFSPRRRRLAPSRRAGPERESSAPSRAVNALCASSNGPLRAVASSAITTAVAVKK